MTRHCLFLLAVLYRHLPGRVMPLHVKRVEGPALFGHTAVAKFTVQVIGCHFITCIGGEGLAATGGDGATQAGDAQVAQAIYADVVGNFLHCATGGNEFCFLRDVDAEVTGMAKWGRTGAQMNLFRSLAAQGSYQAFHGVPAHNGVIDDDETLAFDLGFDHVIFQVYLQQAQTLIGLDKSAVAVAILDDGLAIGNAGTKA